MSMATEDSEIVLSLKEFIREDHLVTNQPVNNISENHSSAILMCEQATITDPEIQDLCVQIVQAQKEEIAQMKTIMERLR